MKPIGKLLSETFPFLNGLKQGGVLSPFVLNSGLEYPIRKFQGNVVGFELNGMHSNWSTLMMVICWAEV
jgi:hypothetical protein